MNMVPKYTPSYTYEDYLLWEGKWELIDGLPYAMSPAPTTKHQRISSELNYLLVAALKHCKYCRAYSPINWKIANDTVLQPDALVICKPLGNAKYLDFPPALVAEIISPSSSLTDRREKFEIYEAQGVKYYIIADPGFNKIEIFELVEKTYQPVAINPPHYTFMLEDSCIAALNFTGLFED
jgi:Uma2 family endonuclease